MPLRYTGMPMPLGHGAAGEKPRKETPVHRKLEK